MHLWTCGCIIQNQRLVRSLSCVILKPKLCTRRVPLLGAAPRTPDYCMDRAGASSTELEPQPGWTARPYHLCTAWSTWGGARLCNSESHREEHLKRKLVLETSFVLFYFFADITVSALWHSQALFFTLLSSSASWAKWWNVGQCSTEPANPFYFCETNQIYTSDHRQWMLQPLETEHAPWSAAFREVGHIYLCSSECPGAWAELLGLKVKVTLTRLPHGPPSPLCSFRTLAQRLLVMTEALRGTKEQGEGTLLHRGIYSTQVPKLLLVWHVWHVWQRKGDLREMMPLVEYILW